MSDGNGKYYSDLERQFQEDVGVKLAIFDNGNGHNGSEEKERTERLKCIKEREVQLIEAASGDIPHIPALIFFDDEAIIRKWSINVIQGQSGVHKSRFAARLCSLLLSMRMGDRRRFFGFRRSTHERPAVVYIDTERSLKAEFPQAIQSIAEGAGFDRSEIKRLYDDGDFIFNSMYDTPTPERLEYMRLILDNARERTNGRHMFVIIDVVTDCVVSFNDDRESSELLRYMRVLCEDCDSTVFLVIHENPGSDKARGHLGTEGFNKSGTVIKVGFIRDTSGNETNAVQLKFLKVRHNGKPLGIILEYDKNEGLVTASKETLAAVEAAKQGKAPIDQVRDEIIDFFGQSDEVLKADLIDYLSDQFGAGRRTIEKRIKSIVQNDLPIDGKGYRLKRETKKERGSPVVYRLVPLNG